MRRLLLAVLLAIALVPLQAAPTLAGSWHHHHPRISWSIGIGPIWLNPWAPAYAYRPPPRVIYVPRPPRVVVVPASTCREFRGNAIIDASGRPFYGTACLLADGRWHIVN